MAAPTYNTLTNIGQGLVFQISDTGGAVDVYVYEHLYTTKGADQPKLLKRIQLTKANVDTIITAIQTTE